MEKGAGGSALKPPGVTTKSINVRRPPYRQGANRVSGASPDKGAKAGARTEVEGVHVPAAVTKCYLTRSSLGYYYETISES